MGNVTKKTQYRHYLQWSKPTAESQQEECSIRYRKERRTGEGGIEQGQSYDYKGREHIKKIENICAKSG